MPPVQLRDTLLGTSSEFSQVQDCLWKEINAALQAVLLTVDDSHYFSGRAGCAVTFGHPGMAGALCWPHGQGDAVPELHRAQLGAHSGQTFTVGTQVWLWGCTRSCPCCCCCQPGTAAVLQLGFAARLCLSHCSHSSQPPLTHSLASAPPCTGIFWPLQCYTFTY